MAAVLEKIGNGEARRLDRIFEPFNEAASFVAKHKERLVAEYPEQWIAVYGTQVVASARSLRSLRKLLAATKLDPAKIHVEFLTRKKRALIL